MAANPEKYEASRFEPPALTPPGVSAGSKRQALLAHDMDEKGKTSHHGIMTAGNVILFVKINE